MPAGIGTGGSTGSVSFPTPQEIVISHTDDSIKLGDGTDTVTVTAVGAKKALDVNVADLAIDHVYDSIKVGDGTATVGTTTQAGVVALNVLPLASSAPQAVRLDEVSSSITYVGRAAVGTATSAASWQVQRISVSGVVTAIEWADGDGLFNNVWDNRAALSYG